MTPEVASSQPYHGYLSLSPEWLRETPCFELTLSAQIRFLTPHPFTNQNTASIAYGPLIYCLEDVDNDWVKDHFKSLVFDHTKVKLSQHVQYDDLTRERYVSINAEGGSTLLADLERGRSLPWIPTKKSTMNSLGWNPGKLTFVPYYFRANRLGRGHMRVGVRNVCE